MKLLVAGRGTDPDDWTWTVDGELVHPADVHDDLGEHCVCGCVTAFIGFASGRATTVAAVADVDMTAEQLCDLIAEHWECERDEVLEIAAELLAAAHPYPVGTRIRRWCGELEVVG